jgi:arsenite methyltransferase
MADSKSTQANYGIDAPSVVRNLTIAGIACMAAGPALQYFLAVDQPKISALLPVCGLVAGCCLLFTAGLMVWSSKVGKLLFREKLLDLLILRGDETILDIGCGRGLLLNAVARRVPNGRAIGVDLWQSQDQSGNRPEVTLANASAEGVANRVEIKTADMRDIPLPDGSIDVVVSNIAIHNIPDKKGRDTAIREIARTLKAGGQVALADLRDIDEYAQTLKELGWQDLSVSGLDFTIFSPVRILKGKKPF